MTADPAGSSTAERGQQGGSSPGDGSSAGGSSGGASSEGGSQGGGSAGGGSAGAGSDDGSPRRGGSAAGGSLLPGRPRASLVRWRREFAYAARRLRLRLIRRRLDYAAEEAARPERLARVLPADAEALRAYEREYDALDWFHDAYAERTAEIHAARVARGTTHWRDGKTLYAVCRALQPDVAVETGVRFGSFDAHVLAALQENGRGRLHAMDLPGGPPGPFAYGHLIPDRCRERWTLHAGDARAELPRLLERVGPLDLFLHDSDHRRGHMRFEFEAAVDHLRDGGVLASHDVRLSSLFEAFTAEGGLAATVVCDTGIARDPRATGDGDGDCPAAEDRSAGPG